MSKITRKNWTEKQIQKELINEFIHIRKHKLCASNVYLYNWESDLITINRSNYVTEYEIKCNKWDYLKDFEKEDKHKSFQLLQNLTGLPNYFYYVCPGDMIKIEDVPEYAGLIYIKNWHKPVLVVKKAPILHEEKFNRYEEIAIKLMYKLI